MIKIDLLKNNIHAISALSRLLHDSLGKWTPGSIEEVERWLYEWLSGEIPLAYIALVEDIPVGICSLQYDDGLNSELKPWLGDLCVDEAYRNLGIGKMLINAIKNKAKQEGFNKLYLIAPDKNILNYYKNLGWHIIGDQEYYGHNVTLMEIKL